MSAASTRTRVQRYTSTGVAERADILAVEEPLEVRLSGRPFTVTMRTPGHDLELVLGFLVSEGVVSRPGDVVSAMHCPRANGADSERTDNVVEVTLAPHVRPPDPSLDRHVYTTSACGVCGTASIDAVRRSSAHDCAADEVQISSALVAGLPEALRRGQKVFDRTGGLHAAGLFTADGRLLCLREDVGRHNAVDKVVGWALQRGMLPLRGHVLQVSGRASFELVQKAWLAGIPVLAAVSAPSSLAVELARDAGMTLVGFSRGDRFNVYAGAHRVVCEIGVSAAP